uniref:Uncharacterized protein n=1 Tax=Solanum tuberosum TaxID=4113 RepID=M1A3W9_SOLTU
MQKLTRDILIFFTNAVTVLSHLQYMHLMLVLGPFATMQAIAAILSFWPHCRLCFQVHRRPC